VCRLSIIVYRKGPQKASADRYSGHIVAYSTADRFAAATKGGDVDTDLADKRLTGIIIELGRHIAIFAVTDGRPVTLSEAKMSSPGASDHWTDRDLAERP
jgi:hypothetical protein